MNFGSFLSHLSDLLYLHNQLLGVKKFGHQETSSNVVRREKTVANSGEHASELHNHSERIC